MSGSVKQLHSLPRLIIEQNKQIMCNEKNVEIDFENMKEQFSSYEGNIDYSLQPLPSVDEHEAWVQIEPYDKDFGDYITIQVVANHQWLCDLFGVKEEIVAVHGPTRDCDQGKIEGYVTTDTCEQLSDALVGKYDFVKKELLEAIREGNSDNLEVIVFA